ncbi:MAG: hypothetical protein JWO95_347, partial [Verrucomicrobiales bacterium]|nr:hypothetical protein [Verrucomicrobiales bacterium]
MIGPFLRVVMPMHLGYAEEVSGKNVAVQREWSVMFPITIKIAARTFWNVNFSFKKTHPKMAAKSVLVSRIAETGPMGLREIAQTTFPYARLLV